MDSSRAIIGSSGESDDSENRKSKRKIVNSQEEKNIIEPKKAERGLGLGLHR